MEYITVFSRFFSPFGQILDFLLPPRCIMTGEAVDVQGMLAPSYWQKLNFIDAPFCDSCGYAFDFSESTAKAFCPKCMEHAPVYDRARACLRYDGASRDLILRFKHADGMHVAPSMIDFMVTTMRRDGLDDADIVIPVPLHRFRLWRRRYNQAAILASGIGRKAGIRHIPDMLVRTRHTPSQGHKRAGERAKNVRAAFALRPRYADIIMGKKILLVDDVYTTGATVNECATVLKNAGATDVLVLTFARVN